MLKCNASGNPEPSFQWEKAELGIVGYKSTITLKISKPVDFGGYLCRVSNGVGRTDHVVNVFEVGKCNKSQFQYLLHCLRYKYAFLTIINAENIFVSDYNYLLYNTQCFISKLAIVKSDIHTCADTYVNHICMQLSCFSQSISEQDIKCNSQNSCATRIHNKVLKRSLFVKFI